MISVNSSLGRRIGRPRVRLGGFSSPSRFQSPFQVRSPASASPPWQLRFSSAPSFSRTACAAFSASGGRPGRLSPRSLSPTQDPRPRHRRRRVAGPAAVNRAGNPIARGPVRLGELGCGATARRRFEQTAELSQFAALVDERGEGVSPTLSAVRVYREHRAAGRRGTRVASHRRSRQRGEHTTGREHRPTAQQAYSVALAVIAVVPRRR